MGPCGRTVSGGRSDRLAGLFLLEAGGAQVAEFVENDEVAADELVCGAALASGAELGFEVVDQVDDVVAPAAAPFRMQDRAMATARWVLPVPPTSTMLR